MAERCAVIGVGQTHHKAKREDVSIAGLVALIVVPMLPESAARSLDDVSPTQTTAEHDEYGPDP